MHYDRFTRLLHLLLAPGIALQLAVSSLMTHPKPGRPGDLFYALHEGLGVFLLGVLLLHWGWALVRRGAVPFGQLFPWFTPDRYAPLVADARQLAGHLLRFRPPPDTGQPSPLANAVQGLGLLAALLLAVTGTLILLYAPENARMSGWLHLVKEFHEALGPLMWGYLGLHAGMAILHQMAGHHTLRPMFLEWRTPGPDNHPT